MTLNPNIRIFEKVYFLNINNMTENKNLKSLNDKLKRRPHQGDVAKRAGISRYHLSNIVAGRRKASPELEKKILDAYRRVIK